LEVTHLVTNGCSFTFGDELENPKTQAWPALLANKLGLPIVNLAQPGTGNDCILRRTTEYLYENLATGSKPLVVIAWSQDWRREAWFLDDYYGHPNFNDYGIIAMPKNKTINDHERALIGNWSEEDIYRKTLQIKLSMMHLLKHLNVPYIITNYAYSHYDSDISKLKERFSHMQKHLDEDPYLLGNMYNLLPELPKMPGGHDGYEAQHYIADLMYSKINDSYQIVPSNHEYLTVKEFMRDTNYLWDKLYHWANID
jgi:hypothetical protein